MPKISKDKITYYLMYLTVGYFDDENVPPSTVEGYAAQVPYIKAKAEKQGDLPWLKLALEYLLAHPEVDCSEYRGPHYAYSDAEMRGIFRYLLDNIWPDAGPTPPTALNEVEMVPMSDAEWKELRVSQEIPMG